MNWKFDKLRLIYSKLISKAGYPSIRNDFLMSHPFESVIANKASISGIIGLVFHLLILILTDAFLFTFKFDLYTQIFIFIASVTISSLIGYLLISSAIKREPIKCLSFISVGTWLTVILANSQSHIILQIFLFAASWGIATISVEPLFVKIKNIGYGPLDIALAIILNLLPAFFLFIFIQYCTEISIQINSVCTLIFWSISMQMRSYLWNFCRVIAARSRDNLEYQLLSERLIWSVIPMWALILLDAPGHWISGNRVPDEMLRWRKRK